MNDCCLVLDATNRWVLCGIGGADGWHARTMLAPGEASARLAPMIAEVMAESGRRRPDWIVAARGPGSFTGARLTVSMARDLAQLWDLPVLGVESLVFYAYLCRRKESGTAPIGVLVDGKQRRVFARLVEPNTTPLEWAATEVLDVSPLDLAAAWPASTRIFADDETAVRAYLEGAWSEAVFDPLPAPDAAALYELAQELGGRAQAATFAELHPVYARPDPARAKYPDGYNPAPRGAS